jgi:16S rRNA (cytosine1402-N4)-methyltransferase
MEIIHTPVLVEETIHYLAPRESGELLVDATLGEGGHSYAFLSRFPDLRIIGIDADRDIQKVARERLNVFGDRIILYTGWSQDFFVELQGDLRSPGDLRTPEHGGERPGRILIDLGVSYFHYEKGGRGFSFRKDEDLDMRIDTERGESAASLIRRLSERELADLIYQNGGERFSRRIARLIVEERRRSPVRNSLALAELVSRAVPAAYRHGPAHPATRTFQALRIAVNGELERLPALLEAALAVLKPGGRLGVISFHSGEDRVVKNFFRSRSKGSGRGGETPINGESGSPAVGLVTPKPVGPGDGEIQRNPPSRSAKLRVVEKLREEDGG